MRVFERGSRRWTIELDGSSIVTRTYVHDELDGERRHTRRTAFLAKWDADRMVASHLAEGYARVGGEDYLELHDHDFEEALAADPDDADTYVVYGDWLAERGDAWGQLILVQHALHTLPRFGATEQRDKLEREQALLMFRNAARLWGWLGETIVNEDTQTYAFDLVQPQWFCGFVRELGLHNIGDRGEVTFDAMIAELARLPVMSLVRTLVFTDDDMLPRHLASLATPSWPQLTALEVRSEYGFTRVGELFDPSPLVPIFDGRAPRLERLLLIGASPVAAVCEPLAASPCASQLTSLSMERCQWSEPAIAALASGRFTALQQLTISGTGIGEHTRERLAGVAAKVRVERRELPDDTLDD